MFLSLSLFPYGLVLSLALFPNRMFLGLFLFHYWLFFSLTLFLYRLYVSLTLFSYRLFLSLALFPHPLFLSLNRFPYCMFLSLALYPVLSLLARSVLPNFFCKKSNERWKGCHSSTTSRLSQPISVLQSKNSIGCFSHIFATACQPWTNPSICSSTLAKTFCKPHFSWQLQYNSNTLASDVYIKIKFTKLTLKISIKFLNSCSVFLFSLHKMVLYCPFFRNFLSRKWLKISKRIKWIRHRISKATCPLLNQCNSEINRLPLL